MDEQTALVLALQLVALFSIAGALLLYLICKIRSSSSIITEGIPGAGKPILVTSCDTAAGLQIAIHLANRGFRVFAGLKEGAAAGDSNDSVQAKVIRSWQKYRESLQGLGQGALVALPLDVTREDLLHEAVDIIRAHLPAGEDGIWAIVNTSGLAFRGRLDQQDVAHWDAMLKTNVVGLLRTARTFQGLLRTTCGRIITVGADDSSGNGLVAFTATRYAIKGASNALRDELAPLGIKVSMFNPTGIQPELLFATPKLQEGDSGQTLVEITGCLNFYPLVLPNSALDLLDVSITTKDPKKEYNLNYRNWSKPLQVLKVV